MLGFQIAAGRSASTGACGWLGAVALLAIASAPAVAYCSYPTDCNDGQHCTSDACVEGACVFAPRENGDRCCEGNVDCCSGASGSEFPFAPSMVTAECPEGGPFACSMEVSCDLGAIVATVTCTEARGYANSADFSYCCDVAARSRTEVIGDGCNLACTTTELCGNGFDDNCDLSIDEPECCDPAIGCCGPPTPEDTPALCSNDVDDNCNELIDCEELSCFGVVAEDCSNEKDDDCDGLIDGADVDCGPLTPEACHNGIDDDGDLLVDCQDPDCVGEPYQEVCGDGDGVDDVDEDCDGGADFCDSACSTEEICGDGIDQDCDGLEDDVDETLCNPRSGDRPAQGDCDERCGCDAKPVDLLTRQAYVGSHEDARIESPQGGPFDLVFSRTWDSFRAGKDDIDDRLADARLEQWPSPRILGPGWRHSYDTRLVLEGDLGTGQPHSVLLSTEGADERLFFEGDDLFGRVPGRAIEAERVGNVWTVTVEDGTQLELLEGAPTKNHPAGNVTLPSELEPEAERTVQRQARLRTIIPRGVSGYRVRVWHEQDAAAEPTIAPPGACVNVDLAGGLCDSGRGLLVAVAAEWLDGATWRRGSSLEFKYTVLPGTLSSSRTQFLLTQVLEGADRDESSPTPTILAEYASTTGTPSWRRTLTTVASCVDRRSPTTDGSGTSCVADPGALLYRYVPSTGDEAHLLAKVQRPARSTAGALTVVDDEEFGWDDSGTGVFRVSTHMSAGIVLSAPGGDAQPDGVMTWSRNGFTKRVTYKDAWPTKTERCLGEDCVVLSERDPQPQTLDSSLLPGKEMLGNRASIAAGGDSVTLRALDFQGNATHELEIVPSGSTPPTMVVTTSGEVETVTVSGAMVEIRRATRNYFSTNDSAPRLLASATYTSRDIHNPGVGTGSAVRKFPTQALAGDPSLSWIFLNGSVTARPTPRNHAVLDGTAFFFDVDASDFDSGVDNWATEGASNALLNETGERELVWTHRVRTKQNGDALARSSRVVVDRAGRTHLAFEHENDGGSNADERTLAKSETQYEEINAATLSRLRGQPRKALQFPNANAGSSIVAWKACASDAFDAHSRMVCRKVPQAPVDLVITEKTETGPNGGLRTTHRTKGGMTTRLTSYQDHFPAGPVFESGMIGGNRSITSWSTSADATAALNPVLVQQTDSAGTPLVKTENTYDAYGRLLTQVVKDGADAIQHSTAYSYAFDDSTIKQVQRAVTSSTSVQTTSDIDPATGRILEVIEEDGDVITNTYASSGVDRGRLMNVARNGAPVQSFEYDVDGRVTAIWNGDEKAATYAYAEDGRLLKETLSGVSVPAGGHLNRTYSEELVRIGGAGPRYRATRVKTRSDVTTIRDVRTISDHLGRPLRQCDVMADATCATPLVEWVYDSKGAYASGPFTVEGTGRTVTLTNNNMNGRLAYVTHPAGATFYEYDALGRATKMVTYEGALPVAALLDESKMKVIDQAYSDGTGELTKLRYPSGRTVSYGFGTGTTLDRRGPSEVLIRVNLDGASTIQRIASNVVYNVDGAAASWEWGRSLVPAPQHVITRDMLGRVTNIVDQLGTSAKAELQYNDYDGDGDVAEIKDLGPYATVLELQFNAPLPARWGFAYGERDMLQDWDYFGGRHTTTTIDPANGKRTSETFDGNTFTYNYTGEVLDERRLSGMHGDEIALSWSVTTRDLSSLDYGDDGVADVSSLEYSPRGDLVSATTTAGRYLFARDERMQRWKKEYPTAGHGRTFRYTPGGELIDYDERTSGFTRDEFIYLQGMPIGVTHTESSFPSPVSWWLSPDAMGTPRRALERNNTTFRQATRLIMNAWGTAKQTSDFSDLGWTPIGRPSLPFRLPGQVADEELFTLIENRWRTYLPDLGVYLQPDPAHASSVQTSETGPQAYAYASGRPLRLIDPDGLKPRFTTMDDAAKNAAWIILYHVGSKNMEGTTTIYYDKCEKCFDYGTIAFGDEFPAGVPAYVSGTVTTPASSRDVADIHNHPSGSIEPSYEGSNGPMRNDIDQALLVLGVSNIYIATAGFAPSLFPGTGAVHRWYARGVGQRASFVRSMSVSGP